MTDFINLVTKAANIGKSVIEIYLDVLKTLDRDNYRR